MAGHKDERSVKSTEVEREFAIDGRKTSFRGYGSHRASTNGKLKGFFSTESHNMSGGKKPRNAAVTRAS